MNLLAAQLKVNLRPLWSPTADALAVLSKRFGDVVWDLLFEQLKVASLGQPPDPSPDWMSEEEGDHDPISEMEKTWRDPSAHKLRSSVAKRLLGNAASYAVVRVSANSISSCSSHTNRFLGPSSRGTF